MPGARLTNSRTALMLAAAIMACSGGPVAPPGRGTTGPISGAGPVSSTALAGTWRRNLVFIDDLGYLHSSETTWTFVANGTALRTIVATNHTLGAFDTSVTSARWRLDGTNLTIEFVAPSPGSIVLEARVQGDSLFLAGQEYLRIS